MNKKTNNLIVIGDTHGKNTWEKIDKETANKVIFLGDYFDSFSIPFNKQIENFKNIINYKKNNMDKVVLLLGNHDYHYLSYVTEHYSGYQPEHTDEIAIAIEDALDEGLIQICYIYNYFIFSHAGITKTWYEDNVKDKINIRDDINNLFKTNPERFKFTPSNPMDNIGDSITQSPLWVRPRALLSDKIDNLTQVVGHTHQEHIKINDEVIFIDTLEYGDEYLIINKNTPEIGIIK